MRHPFMLDLLDGVPTPEGGDIGIGPVQMPWIAQQLMRQYRGKMLQRHGCGQAYDRRPLSRKVQYRRHVHIQPRNVVTVVGNLPVEGDMLAAMRDFLPREGRNLPRQLVWRAIPESPYGLDEKGFAPRKGD